MKKIKTYVIKHNKKVESVYPPDFQNLLDDELPQPRNDGETKTKAN